MSASDKDWMDDFNFFFFW